MKRLIPLLLLTFAGCVETKDEFVLNPDGTGKVKHQAVFAPVNLNLNEAAEKPSPEEEMKKAVRDELEKAEGVEAWSGVTYVRDAAGKINFTGTAYFRDISKLKFHNNGFKAAMFKPKWANGTLELASERKEGGAKKPVPTAEAEIEKAIADARAQFQQMKPMMVGVLGAMKTDMSFRLPGAVTESSNLKREADGTLRIMFTGEQMIELMNKVLSDDVQMREQIKAGRNVLKDGPEADTSLNQQLFGEAKPVRATVKVEAKPQFDYAVEIAAAKAGMATVFKALGTAAPVAVTPAGAAKLKGTTVGGVRWVRVVDEKRGIRPFNWSPGFTLSIIAELPGAVLQVRKGELIKAEADNGEDLLPAKDWDRKIQFANLSEDKTVAVFEVKLASPGDGVKGFKEISGEITYVVGQETRKVDLGFPELATGAEGKELAATIKTVKPSQWEKGSFEVELKVAGKRETIKEAVVLDAAGQRLETKINGFSSFNNQSTLTLLVKAGIPKDGKIVLEMYEGLQEFTAPFRIQNITLLGTPVK